MMLTTTEAAEVLGVQPQTVTRHILRGMIQAEKRGRDYLIRQEEIERFKQERRRAGRPKAMK
jgi:excisionase family DNA binding protein